ncbi:MAG: hypothetical protein KGZ86_06945 [Candidatus Latescibacteria bacterium]|nr:hypothetical protein [Candidatus Latescibacterota bacterium]
MQTILSPRIDRFKGCFIATAIYGSAYEHEVLLLQRFRDEIMLKSFLGKSFVTIYYFVSPPIVKIITKNDFLRKVSKAILINPILRIAKEKLKN